MSTRHAPRPLAAPAPLSLALALALAAGCSTPPGSRADAAAPESVVLAEPSAAPPPAPVPMALRAEKSFVGQLQDQGWNAGMGGETYAEIRSTGFQQASQQPVSTFSIDVDTGSYANVRRILRSGVLPPPDAVRTEEFLNYFDYAYPAPAEAGAPFAVTTELAPAPWAPERQLLLVGIEGYAVAPEAIPAANLVFLVDTSGSMQSADKLGLLKESLALLVAQLRPQDRVAIVAYAGSAGLVLPSTPGTRRGEILAALERLQAGGSTNGGAGLALAYAVAGEHFLADGVNRVVLATDGDFNVGTTDLEALKALVATQRDAGVALTTLGFGTGNYNDALAEQLADIGDGNHAYIDSLEEGHKVLVDELSSTMLTIARDVKVQLDFDPACVARWRLLGYENRLLAEEEFDDDGVDAGEIGAGHDVTALYEIEPRACHGSERLAELRLRFKHPLADRSELLSVPVLAGAARPRPGARLALAATVAAFAEALRGSPHLGGWTLADVAAQADALQAPDPYGHVAGFRELAHQAAALQPATVAVAR